MEHLHDQPNSALSDSMESLVPDAQPIVKVGIIGRITRRLGELSPHMARYAEISAACSCSGVCSTCIGTATASIVLPMVVEKHDKS